MRIVPHSAPLPGHDQFIAVDRQHRLSLSAGLRRELSIIPGTELYVGYDKVNKRLALARPDIVRLTNVRPYKFDARGYAYARKFIDDNEISDIPARYYFEGQEKAGENAGWTMFRLDGHAAADQPD